ncbi:MAG TPA: DUF1501 domain-containing protein [Fimbriimonadaceae bacterium]|nr:DUF1501 domain-containing protein [Fimbriimonadaceae bacterium]
MSDLISRRDMMKRGGVIAIGLAAPRWLSTIAKADMLRVAQGGKPSSDTVLVVCQFSGGNDGLNTFIPYANKTYYNLRPTLGIEEGKVLHANDQMGFHPSMQPIADLYKAGKVAVINSVGYPNPNLSHFASMDIWQSASPEKTYHNGWIGRHLDNLLTHGDLDPVLALGLSTEKPLALSADHASVPCFASLSDVKNLIGDPAAEEMLREIQGPDAPAGSPTRVVQKASKAALDAMDILSHQLGGYTPKQTYANDPFGNGFKQIAQLIATSPKTRIVYFSAGGFDTHARQADTQAKLLGEFSAAVAAFQAEMEAIGRADKVLVMTFSEFGRRAAENGSAGTDHGTAAPMFLIGKPVKGGMYGNVPDLDNLHNGNLVFSTDFRQVYAATLDQWMGGDSEVVLGQKFDHVQVFG